VRSLGLLTISVQVAVMVAGVLAVCCSERMAMEHAGMAMDACSMKHHGGGADGHEAHGGQPASDCDGPTIGCSMSDVAFFPLLVSIGVLPEAVAGPTLMSAGDITPAAPLSALRLAAVPLSPPPRV